MRSSARAARGEAVRDLAKAIIAAVVLTDDQGTTYVLHVEDMDLSQEPGPVPVLPDHRDPLGLEVQPQRQAP